MRSKSFLKALSALFCMASFASYDVIADGESCVQELDMVLVLDESGSVSDSNFAKVQNFMGDFLETLPIATGNVNVGLVTFSSDVRVHFDLGDHLAVNKSKAINTVRNFRRSRGSTETGKALSMANTILMHYLPGRQFAPKLVIIVTDGDSDNRNETYREAESLQKLGYTVLVIGVGNSINTRECRYMAGCKETGDSECPGFVHSDWGSINSRVSQLLQLVCSSAPKNAKCSEWSDYGPCEGECGQTGTQTSTRTEIEPATAGTKPCPSCPVPKGRSCEQNGGLVRNQSCSLPPCAVDAGCSDFSEWSEWSSSCGSATRKRVRTNFNNPPAQYGGKTCEEQGILSAEESESTEFTPCPVTQVPGPWGPWSTCTAVCGGGTQERVRGGIPQDGELYGGQRLEEQGIQVHQTRECNTHPCPVDATCGNFGEWSECTKTCGGGSRTRSRTPWSRDEKYGGKSCEEQFPDGATDIELCNVLPCPIDEVLGEWGEWTECSASCDAGTRSRTRLASPVHAQYGGKTMEQQNEALPEDKKMKREESEKNTPQ